MSKSFTAIGFLFVLFTLSFSQVATTSFEFTAKSLYEDPTYQTHIRTVFVHTVEQFEKDKEYPVLIYLPGWPGNPEFYELFTEVLGKLLDQGKIDPMIIFIPSGIGGLYTSTNYWDSTTNGGYGSYIAKDLLKYINENYPVIKAKDASHDRNYWILSGWSMGGGGAGRLAYKYPELFSGMASFSGDLTIEAYKEIFEFVKKENENNCNITHPAYGSFPDAATYWTHLLWESASVFSPGPAPSYALFPLDQNCDVVESVWEKWKVGHADYLAEQYYENSENDKSSMNVFLSVGKNELLGTEEHPFNMYNWTKPFYDLLEKHNVPVELVEHDKGHWFDDEQAEQLILWADAHFKKNATKVESKTIRIPESAVLIQNYPNPFNPQTTIKFSLPIRENINLAVYDLNGREIATLFDGTLQAGTHNIMFDGSNLTSGTYMCRLQSDKTTLIRKITLVK